MDTRRFSAAAHQQGVSLRTTLVLFGLVLSWATATRFFNLTLNSLWSDELWGVVASTQGTFYAMLHNLAFDDSHPPGYQTLLYVWMQVFGSSDSAVRIPSAMAGVGAVIWTYRLGARHFNVMTGLLAAAMMSGSFQAIYYSQEARAYPFLMLLAPACADLFLQLFVRQRTGPYTLPLFWIVTTAMIYMHYVGFVFIGSMMLLWTLLWWRDGKPADALKLARRAFIPCLLLYLPWLPIMYIHLTGSPESWSTPIPDEDRLLQTWRYLAGPDTPRLVLFSSLLIGTVATLVSGRHHPRFCAAVTAPGVQRQLFCIAWLALVPLLIFVMKSLTSQSVYTHRHFTYAIPLLTIFFAWGPAIWLQQRVQPQRRGYALTACLLALFAIDIFSNNQQKLYAPVSKEDYRGAAAILKRDARFLQAGSKGMVISNHHFFSHYLRQYKIRNRLDFYLRQPAQVNQIPRLLQKNHTQQFYYLENSTDIRSPLMIELEKKFLMECISQLNSTRIARFRLRSAKVQQVHNRAVECP
jgi:mannosyltransferase